MVSVKNLSIRWMGHVAHRGEVNYAYNIFMRTSEVKRPFMKPKVKP
jgi:hypothetical protein